ncbi:Phosphoribosylformylglycinamidine synthase [Poriferisphaera corsica]|uniref:Phosphoribosylformylglycinamidine synthase n=1 Tax=Poriferisphaera corsica TaxID=2528020 RepID=A0A517YUF6_9BACT|nr:phosphoribosylformylglycinamidine synthase I [Poriferisphaera corsica]QDU33858.1 Phosphoribosylformylglycinamidine synthase [Poriferisphaera corsica]
MKPKTLIIRTAGTNCDLELSHAFQLAGAETETHHLNDLIENPDQIARFDIIGFPGGFSYGDDVAAGRILANRLKHQLLEPLQDAVKRGVPMIGICNGFQVLVKLGLLPDPHAAVQTVTLADNTNPRFLDRWVGQEVDSQTKCIWTQGLTSFELPIAHGEGRFVTENDNIIAQLKANKQVAIRYPQNDNPNGSVDNIAGICDPTGLILGLMPHPERYIDATNHPQWTRQSEEVKSNTPAGLQFFINAVSYVKDRNGATV